MYWLASQLLNAVIFDLFFLSFLSTFSFKCSCSSDSLSRNNSLPLNRMSGGWAHSCCSHDALQVALSSEVHSIESDVVLSSVSGEPVMAHPPSTHSDLSFQEFLEIATSDVDSARRKHLKLDFKDAEVVEPCLKALASKDLVEQTIYLNADIIHGPGADSSSELKISADKFIDQCVTLYPRGILSLGWKVDLDIEGAVYSEKHCEEMLSILQSHELLDRRIVLAVAARPLSRDSRSILTLMRESLPLAELLVWTGTGESPVTESLIEKIRESFCEISSHRISYDVALEIV